MSRSHRCAAGAAPLAPLLALILASAAAAQPAQTRTSSQGAAHGFRAPIQVANAAPKTESPGGAAAGPKAEAQDVGPPLADASRGAPKAVRAPKKSPAKAPAAATKVPSPKTPNGIPAAKTRLPEASGVVAGGRPEGPPAAERPPPSPGAPGAPGKAALKKLRDRLSWAGRPEQILQEFGRVAQRYVPVQEMEGLTDPLSLLLLALLAAIVARSARKLRGKLLRSGIIPRFLLVLSIAGRFVALSAGVLVGIRLAPHWLGAAVPWVLLAAAVAVGWSLRDLFPDLLAGIVVLSERRIRPGVWVTGEGFSGSVDRLGPRAAWLQTAAGQRISVPNHRLLAAPVIFREGLGAHHETALVVGLGLPAETVRVAIEEASAGSPWVALRPALSVERDSLRADHWRVRVRLLDLRYAPRFDGELLERTEEALRAAREI